MLKIQLQQSQTETEKVKKDFALKSIEAENYKKELTQIKTENQNLENTLNMIKSAKFFKLWQGYCKLRDSILKRQ